VTPAALPGDAGPAELAALAWRRLQPERWPLPRQAFPAGSALVGGAVRDALLDRLPPQPDLDLVVESDAIQLCRRLGRSHGGSVVVLDAERSIARLVIQGWSVDLARQEGASLAHDLGRRDYRLNAMALPLAEGLLCERLADLMLPGVHTNTACGYLVSRALLEAWLQALQQRPALAQLPIDHLINRASALQAPQAISGHWRQPVFRHGSFCGTVRSWQQ